MSSNKEGCIFCNKTNCKVIYSTENFFIIRDTAYPVTKHHTLIVTNRHVEDFFNLTKKEMNDLDEILKKQKEELKNLDLFEVRLDFIKLLKSALDKSFFKTSFVSKSEYGSIRMRR